MVYFQYDKAFAVDSLTLFRNAAHSLIDPVSAVSNSTSKSKRHCTKCNNGDVLYNALKSVSKS